jgi:hypothetical protein
VQINSFPNHGFPDRAWPDGSWPGSVALIPEVNVPKRKPGAHGWGDVIVISDNRNQIDDEEALLMFMELL